MARTRRARPWDAYRRAEAAHVARIEDTPAEDRRLPAWAALVALLPLLGLAAWAVDGVAVPALADLVRSGPALAAALVALVGCATFALDALPVLKPRTRVEVLYHREPSWLPGETTPERDERLNSGRAAAPGSWYPDSGPGRVISVRDIADVASGRLPSLRHMADRDRPCVTLDLTAAEIAGLASRRRKVATTNDVPCREEGSDVLGALGGEAVVVPLTLEDRLGATLAPLVKKYGSRAAVETAEFAADFERREAELVPEVRHEPHAFALDFERLRKALPPTVTHTGTGLYSVKVTPTHSDDTQSGAPAGQVVTLVTGGLGILSAWKGGYIYNATRAELRAIVSHTDGNATLEGVLTNWQAGDDLDIYDAWSTVQAAHDQHFVDQGAANFTAENEYRLYTGTYNECVTLQTTMQPTAQYRLRIAAPSGQTVVVTNNALATHTFTSVSMESVIFQNFTITTNVAGKAGVSYMGRGCEVIDCTFNGTGVQGFSCNGNPTYFLRCTFDANFTGYSIYSPAGLACRCIFRSKIGCNNVVSMAFEACTFDGANAYIAEWCQGVTWPFASRQVDLRNCLFYNTTYAIVTTLGVAADQRLSIHVKNCIFHTVGTVFTALLEIGRVESDRNCFYNCTKIGSVNSVNYTALADWQALADEDGDSPDANSIAADPLLTSPATGDFSLGAASPCKWTGVGAGVTTGINNVTFDGPHPDRGAWSSGPVPAPSWAGGVSNIVATNLAAAGEVGLTWDEAAATVLTNLSKGYVIESRTVAGPGAYVEHGRSITESFTVGGLTDGVAREFRVTAYTRVEAEPFAVASDTDTATPTGVTIPDAPEIEATDLLNQSDVKVDIVADNPADVSTIYYRLVPGGVLQTWGVTVTGDGSQTITGLLVHSYVIFAVAQRAGCNSVPSNLEFLNVQAADQYTATRTALYEWVKGIVGNPIVIWRNANAPQPTRQYVSIHMGPMTVMGRDYHSGADVDGIETVTGDREFVFSIQIHGKPSNEDGSASISMLERLRSSLEKRSIQATLSAAGLGYVAVEGSGDLAGIGGTEFEARTFMDIRFRTSYQDTDDVGYVGTVTAPVGTLE